FAAQRWSRSRQARRACDADLSPGSTNVAFELQQSNAAGAAPGDGPSREHGAPAPTPDLGGSGTGRQDILDQLLRTFEQWGHGVRQEFQRHDDQSRQLARQLNDGLLRLSGDTRNRTDSLQAKIDELNSRLGQLIGETDPLLVEVAALASDRVVLNAKLENLEARIGHMVPRWQMAASFAAIVILGAGLCYLAYPDLRSAITQLMSGIPA